MSDSAAAKADMCCANCGAAEVDNIKLEECDGCDLVKYCSEKCKEEHREEHYRKLFTQPDEIHLGECPICFSPMPIDPTKYVFHPCCSSFICKGCVYANRKSNGTDRCPFCREPMSSSDEETNKRMMKRVKANDPVALRHKGLECYREGNYDGAVDHFTKAAELGDADAHCNLGFIYKGEGVENDEEKAAYHYEKAAIGGHPGARNNLGVLEEENGNMKRAVKHFIIAANLGYGDSMKCLWGHY